MMLERTRFTRWTSTPRRACTSGTRRCGTRHRRYRRRSSRCDAQFCGRASCAARRRRSAGPRLASSTRRASALRAAPVRHSSCSFRGTRSGVERAVVAKHDQQHASQQCCRAAGAPHRSFRASVSHSASMVGASFVGAARRRCSRAAQASPFVKQLID